METRVFFTFMAAVSLMIALPGPSVVLTVAHGISFGWRRALITVAGETAGIAVQLAVATVGLAALLHTVAAAFEWIRWAGAAYLAYLGVKLWTSSRAKVNLETNAASGVNLFVQGLAVTVPNPKSLLFIAAFLPQFIDAGRGLGAQLAVIVPTFLAITFVVTSLWAILAGTARDLLFGPRALTVIMRTAGILMIVAALGMVPLFKGL